MAGLRREPRQETKNRGRNDNIGVNRLQTNVWPHKNGKYGKLGSGESVKKNLSYCVILIRRNGYVCAFFIVLFSKYSLPIFESQINTVTDTHIHTHPNFFVQ